MLRASRHHRGSRGATGCCGHGSRWSRGSLIPYFPADPPSMGSQAFSPPSKTQHRLVVVALEHFSLPPLKLWISCSIQPNPFPCLLLAGWFRTTIPALLHTHSISLKAAREGGACPKSSSSTSLVTNPMWSQKGQGLRAPWQPRTEQDTSRWLQKL